MSANAKRPDEPLLFLLGVSHHSAAMELRERLFIEEPLLAEILPQIRQRFAFLELAALSTCNRFELMGVAPGGAAALETIFTAFIQLQQRAHGPQAISAEQLKQASYLVTERQAVAHIHRVAASLDSLVLGETQITGQFKDAVALATKLKTLGPHLSRLSQEALATAKKVRTQTAIGRKTVSISHAAIELAQKVFGSLSQHRFLILGAGEMAQVSARYVLSYRPKSLVVVNRTVERAQELIRQLPRPAGLSTSCEAYGLDELPRLLAQTDVVISSTAAPGWVLQREQIRRAQVLRRQKPLVLLDIALPRDIDPSAGQLDEVYLFDIDDLQQVVEANTEERQRAAEEAQALIERSTEQFEHWRQTLSLKPALGEFRDYLHALIQTEAQKSLAKEHFKNLNEKQRQGIDSMLAAIVSKISADASRQVLNPPAGYYADQLIDALRLLFAAPNPQSHNLQSKLEDEESA